MFSITRLFAFVVIFSGLAVANAQNSTAKIPANKSTSVVSKTTKAQASKPAKNQSVTILQLENPSSNANASLTSQVLHPVAGRSMLQAVPKTETRSIETKFEKNPTTEQTVRTNAMGIEYARGLSNDLSLNVSTDIGTETNQQKGQTKETTDSGLSDIKVEITKMFQTNTQQSFLSGFLTGGLPATRGNITAEGKTLDGNRFSGGMTFGGNYLKQTAGLGGNFGYKLGAAIQLPIKADIKQDVPDYSAYEATGGHKLNAEFFGEKVFSARAKIGGGAGVNMLMPSDISTRTPGGRGSASIGTQNLLVLKAFASFTSGQIEFMPTAVFGRSLGTASEGDLSIESQDSTAVELVTRFSL